MVEYHGSAVLLIFMLEAFFDSYDSVILNNSIPRVRVGYELAIIMSYPISASEIIVLLETPKKYGELVLSLIVKTTDFQLVFNFEQAYSYHIWRAWYNHGSYTMVAKPIRALELHYPMIQFLIIQITGK